MKVQEQQYIHHLVEQSARQVPERIAIEYGEQHISYGRLARLSNRLAHQLLALGMCKGDRVLILSRNRVQVILGLLATLKTGAVFVPVDPATPARRLLSMLRLTKPRYGFVDEQEAEALGRVLQQAEVTTRLLLTGEASMAEESEERQEEEDPQAFRHGDEMCSIYFTSGSTGQPKGVAGRLKGIDHYIRWEIKLLGLQEGGRVSQLTSPAFDAFQRDVFVPLSSGGRLCIPAEESRVREGKGLVEYVQERGVEVLHCVPSVFRVLLSGEPKPGQMEALQYVLLAGETLQVQDVQRWQERCGQRVQLINLYGPTETTMTKLFYQVQPQDVERQYIPVGEPMEGARFLVLDAWGKVCLPGKVGEIYLRTPYRSLGYYGAEQETEKVFVHNPFSQDEQDVIYRTGDLGRVLPDGNLELLGRKDDQVKIRGVRVELGEIESWLREGKGVKEAVVVAYKEFGGGKYLCGYVVAEAEVEMRAVREHLQECVPEVMVPAVLIRLETLPRTISGKVDRQALPRPGRELLEGIGGYVAPRSSLEHSIAELWQRLLHLDSVGMHDHFFALGGHSLLVTQVISGVREELGVELPLRVVFEGPTVEQLARRVEQELQEGQKKQAPPLLPAPRGEQPIPLSYGQQRLWFLDQLEPGSPAYLIPHAWRLQGQLHQQALERSLQRLVQRHESLRTTVGVQNGQLIQFIDPVGLSRLPVVDLGALEGEEREQQVQRLAKQESQQPCDLLHGPLLRVWLLRLVGEEQVLLLTMHHIISDGWSGEIFSRELIILYQAFVEGKPALLPELPVQYADYTLWQYRWLQGEVLQAQLAYWTTQLQGVSPLEIPTDHPRPAIQTFCGAYQQHLFPTSLSAELKRLSQQEGVTLFMTLLAAFQTFLLRYTGQEDIAIGTPIANRTRSEIEGLIGCFVNTLVLRTNLSGNLSFRQLLQRVRQIAMDAYAHQDVPFEHIVNALQFERDLSRNPLFQVTFLMEGTFLQHIYEETAALPGLRLSPLEVESTSVKFDLALSMEETDQGLFAVVGYNTDLFETVTIERMLQHLQTLLEGIVASPEQSLSLLPMLTPTQRQLMLEQWNATGTSFAGPWCLHQLVEAQGERTPDAVALVYEHEHLTHQGLQAHVNRLARSLQGRGVAPETVVGLCVERSPFLLLGILAILKAGGAYLPLDPTYPPERLALLLSNAQVSLLLTQESLLGKLPAYPGEIVCVEHVWSLLEAGEQEPLESQTLPEHLAYVMYTSGSTGIPKGIAVSHRAIANRLLWAQHAHPLTAADRVVQLASFGFDISLWELLGPLLVAAPVILLRPAGQQDSRYLLHLLEEEQITVAHVVPSLLQALLQDPLFATAGHLRLLLCGGETLAVALAERLMQTRPLRLLHFYGPTEASISMTSWTWTPQPGRHRLPIGRAIANMQAYVLDAQMQSVPVAVVGELYIGGLGLARGYCQQPDLTAERFVPHPFSQQAGARLYKTGDLVRFVGGTQPDGTLEYLGRNDQQVKIRGYRIELSEIEAVVRQQCGVQDCLVLVREEEPGHKRLVAYLVAEPSTTLPEEDLRRALKARLPEYMVPTAFVCLDALPLTPNGKLDRQALPSPDGSRAGRLDPLELPQTPLEHFLSSIWSKLLRVERMGRHETFFEVGGDSIQAAIFINTLQEELGVHLYVVALFNTPTIASFASYLGQHYRDCVVSRFGAESLPDPATNLLATLAVSTEEAGSLSSVLPSIEPISKETGSRVPLSYAQQRLWFLDQLEPGSPAYLIPHAWRLQGQLHQQALERSLQGLMQRHESLRTTFEVQDGQPVQVIKSVDLSRLPIVDLGALEGEKREQEAQQLARQESQQPCDLQRGPLLRVWLLRLRQQEQVLLLTMHHIIFDGWSSQVFSQELAMLYRAFVQGSPSPLAPLPIQYADFALWQRQWLQGEILERQVAYWQEQLAGLEPLELPTDHPRPPLKTYHGTQHTLLLPNSLHQALVALGRREQVTQFILLLAAFQILLARYSGQQDIAVGTTIANRTHKEVAGLIGFFVNTLVLRSQVQPHLSFVQLLAQVRKTALGAYAHQDAPFEHLVEALLPERDLSRNPLLQVMFLMEGTFLQHIYEETAALPGLRLSPLEVESTSVKFDLTLLMEETDQGLFAVLRYNTDLFETVTIERMLQHLQTLLEGIVASPEQSLSLLPMLTLTQRQLMLEQWNATGTSFAGPWCLHQLVEAQGERTPDAVALVYEHEHLTHQGLQAHVNRLARFLQGRGVAPETVVGLCVERSPFLLLGILAILKAGGAYLPLDPTYPPERLALLLSNAQVSLLLTQEPLLGKLPAYPGEIVCVEHVWSLLEAGEQEPLESQTLPEHLAYVMYTSGSTGIPKGIAVSHRAIANRLLWAQHAHPLTAADRVVQLASFGFDISLWELLGPLLVAAPVILLRPGGQQDSRYLLHLLEEEQITVAHVVPSLLQALLQDPLFATTGHLRLLLCGGETLAVALAERLMQTRPLRLLHFYGPTEASISMTSWTWTPQPGRHRLPIGRAIANMQAYVLDAQMQSVPVAVVGELYIGGLGLARGYCQQPDLTAERFVPHPFSQQAGARLYKTGDLVRFVGGAQPDGTLEYLGRNDQQVKIRGYRIELSEIEAVVRQQCGVQDCLVLVREEEPGHKRLVAYLVAEPSTTLPEEDLRRALKARLPEYMVPTAFVCLDALPLTPNGKLDRQALPSPDGNRAGRLDPLELPQTPLEHFLSSIWSKLLRVERMGRHETFFEVGGDSIQAAIFINTLQEELGVHLYVVALFDAPTIASFASYLGQHYRDCVVSRFGAESLPDPATIPPAVPQDALSRISTEQVEEIRRVIVPLPPRQQSTRQRKNPPAIFVLSPPRSGSTLLRVMLAGHPALFAPPELELLSFNTLAERKATYSGRSSFWLEGTIRAIMELRNCDVEQAREIMTACETQGFSTQQFYSLLQQWLGERILVEKTPAYALDLEVLKRAEEDFENARYIHLLRHPYGMIHSMEEAKLDQVFFRHTHHFGLRELAELIWLISHQNILTFLQGVPAERHYRLSFEELVQEPRVILEGLCDFLGVAFQEEMLHPYQGKRMTDGIHTLSKMVGDVKFHTHHDIDASVAARWKEHYSSDFLGEITWEMAGSLGYQRPQRKDNESILPPLRPQARQDDAAISLSFAQQRLWFLDQLDPGSTAYLLPSVRRLLGELDQRALEQSLQEMVQRHESLRTTFEVQAGLPVQVIAPRVRVVLPVVDLTDLGEQEREHQAQRLARQESQQPCDLHRGPLLRIWLLRLQQQEQVLLLTMHHIIFDGWSSQVFSQELATLYQAGMEGRPSPLAPLPIQYADFALWQRQWLQEEVLEQQVAYWRAQLAGLEPLELPTDYPRPPVQTTHGAMQVLQLPFTLQEELQALSRREQVTLFMLLLAAFQVLLARYSGQKDIAVGTPIANRTHAGLENLIGFFVNMLVIRTNLTGGPSFLEILEQVRKTALEAYTHQDVPFEQLVEVIQYERDLSRSPLFQVTFSLQQVPDIKRAFGQLAMQEVNLPHTSSKFDLALSVDSSNEGMRCNIEYNTDLFAAYTISRLLEHWQVLLEGIVEAPHARVIDLPLLTKSEHYQLLIAWNSTQTIYDRHTLLHTLVEQHAKQAPDALALVFQDHHLSYGELNRRANALAHYLQALGVGPEMRVGIALQRSLELVSGLLGILKAGAAYVPLDPASPTKRLQRMLSDAHIALLLTDAHVPERSALQQSVTVLGLDTDWLTIASSAQTNPSGTVVPGNLAYVIYTSGSTGTPKGVAIPHAGLLNLVCWHQRTYHVCPSDRATLVAGIAFDASVWELWPSLAAGASVTIADNEVRLSPTLLHDWLLERAITLSFVPTPLTEYLLDLDWSGGFVLRALLTGGDRLRRYAPATLPYPLINHYGPTESTVVTTATSVPAEGDGPSFPLIGQPIDNTQCYVLDAQGQPVPLGIPGELYIAGESLARGYLERADLTAEHFVPHPFCSRPGERLYRTGDLVRSRPNGQLAFLGRLDQQVKIRGFRIEPGEIETALATHPDIEECLVIAQRNQSGEHYMVAYIVSTPSQTSLGMNDLHSYLQERLPDYMIPSFFILLDSLPLTPNGKIDRRALPAPQQESATSEQGVCTRTPLEEQLTGIWCNLLGRSQVGIHDNFFALGGHSLLATRFISQVQATLEVDLPLRSLFEFPTIAALATVIEREQVKLIKEVESEELAEMLKAMENMSGDEISTILSSEI